MKREKIRFSTSTVPVLYVLLIPGGPAESGNQRLLRWFIVASSAIGLFWLWRSRTFELKAVLVSPPEVDPLYLQRSAYMCCKIWLRESTMTTLKFQRTESCSNNYHHHHELQQNHPHSTRTRTTTKCNDNITSRSFPWSIWRIDWIPSWFVVFASRGRSSVSVERSTYRRRQHLYQPAQQPHQQHRQCALSEYAAAACDEP